MESLTVDLNILPLHVRRFRYLRLHLKLTALTVGLLMIGMMTLLALFASLLAPYDVSTMNASDRLQPPSSFHLFGTDSYGRDMFSRIVFGARISLQVAYTSSVLAAIPGIILGTFAAMKNGWIDSLLTQIMDAWLALPGILVALVLTAMLGRSLEIVALALGLATIPLFYRISRSEALRVRNELYVEAAHALGATQHEIVTRHLLPNIVSSLLVVFTITIGRMLLATSALSFIGLGAPPPSPEWGTLLSEGRTYIQQAWWLMVFPGVAIAFTTLGFYLLGDGLRDVLDPHH
jgi:peptide/nickel transport system permease protein